MRFLIFIVLLMTTSAATATDNKHQIEKVLDALHERASTADYEGYFSLYTPGATFIGTDAGEVWTVEAFKAYAKPHFDKGTGWTYLPRDRHIYFSPDENVAWFDELLDNEKLGVTRGTGVLIRVGALWKVSQYHLTIPVPNALASDVANQIKALKHNQ